MTTRAAIYARFSTELQKDRSIDDQVALCRNHAELQGLTVVSVYQDSARSGASVFGRDGLMRMMEHARERQFEVLVVEALDRLSRDMEDLAGIHKRLAFLGIEIRAVHDGTADTVLVGIRGLVGQLQREDGAKKVRRGMAGVLRDGRHPGGRAYGYRAIPGKKGELQIAEGEAIVIRRIFTEYVEGQTPRAIARALNEDGIRPPRGVRWNASTINGNASRGYGIILNDLYVGRIVWNRVRMLKDPDTGKRISRVNPREEWQGADAPHLRIVDPDVWERAQALKSSKANSPKHEHRRPRRILSGLLRCGGCGGGMSTHGRDRHGKLRVRCTAQAESGSCSCTKSFPLERIEAAVFDGMREHLRDPRLIEVYVRRYNAEREKALADTISRRSKIEGRLARLTARRDRMLDMLLDDVVNDAVGRAHMASMKEEQLALEAELAAAGEPQLPLTLHPATIERYLDTVDRLATALADHAGAQDRGSVVADFRALVQSVTVHSRGNQQGFEVEVKGRLAALIGGSAFPERYGGSMVAEAGLEPATYGL